MPAFLTARELAKTLGVSAATVYQRAHAREIPHYRLGDRIMFSLDEVLDTLRRPADEAAMRWWKTFREDFDRPSFQLGIERFGTGFVHDVGRVWQFLCVEEGPGIRDLVLTNEMLGILARQFRVDVKEAAVRLEFMAKVSKLIDIGTRRGSEVIVVSSKELKRRRDEWSRKVQKAKGKSKPSNSAATPESHRSNSGTESEAESDAETKADANELTRVDALTGDKPCSHTAKDAWEFSGVFREKSSSSKIPRK